jgi:hypothetical protein
MTRDKLDYVVIIRLLNCLGLKLIFIKKDVRSIGICYRRGLGDGIVDLEF